MNLTEYYLKTGNLFFKYRGQIPILVFLLATPIIYFQAKEIMFSHWLFCVISLCSAIISIAGFLLRVITIATTPDGTSGRNRTEQVADKLNTIGIYSIVRHPLYLANFMMWFGILCFSFSLTVVVVFSLFFWLYYERIIMAEEHFLSEKYANEYNEYASKTPALIPNISNYLSSNTKFNFKKVLRQEYTAMLTMAFSFFLIDYIRIFKIYEHYNLYRISLILFVISMLIALILRTLKHYTRVLK